MESQESVLTINVILQSSNNPWWSSLKQYCCISFHFISFNCFNAPRIYARYCLFWCCKFNLTLGIFFKILEPFSLHVHFYRLKNLMIIPYSCNTCHICMAVIIVTLLKFSLCELPTKRFPAFSKLLLHRQVLIEPHEYVYLSRS